MKNWYHETIENTQKALATDCYEGLSQEEVNNRQAQYGFNELKGKKKKIF